MTPINVDPKEQTFIEHALSAAARAQRWDRVRVVVAKAAAVSAVIWVAIRTPSPELGIELTICVVLGSMLAAVTATLRSLIRHNTRLVLQALAAPRPQSELVSPPADH